MQISDNAKLLSIDRPFALLAFLLYVHGSNVSPPNLAFPPLSFAGLPTFPRLHVPHFYLFLRSINAPCFFSLPKDVVVKQNNERCENRANSLTVLIKGLNIETTTFTNSFPTPFFARVRRCECRPGTFANGPGIS
jgi:hypothetical protein